MLSYTNVILGNDNSIPIMQEQLQDTVIDNSAINDNSIPISLEQLQDIVIDSSGINDTISQEQFAGQCDWQFWDQ